MKSHYEFRIYLCVFISDPSHELIAKMHEYGGVDYVIFPFLLYSISPRMKYLSEHFIRHS
jgi:hypothetical protein